MNVVFMAKDTSSSVKSLKLLISMEINVICAVVRKRDVLLYDECVKNNIKIMSENELSASIKNGDITDIDYMFSYYWKKVGADIINAPKYGSINFHPGPLPEARGCGYNIALLDSWGYWGATAHYMDEEFDTGRIIEQRRFEIDDNMMTEELIKRTHTELFELFKSIIDKLMNTKTLPSYPQGEGSYYSLSYLEDLKKVELTDKAEEIDRKIKAFWYPPYSGAYIVIDGRKYTLVNEAVLNYIKSKEDKK